MKKYQQIRKNNYLTYQAKKERRKDKWNLSSVVIVKTRHLVESWNFLILINASTSWLCERIWKKISASLIPLKLIISFDSVLELHFEGVWVQEERERKEIMKYYSWETVLYRGMCTVHMWPCSCANSPCGFAADGL